MITKEEDDATTNKNIPGNKDMLIIAVTVTVMTNTTNDFIATEPTPITAINKQNFNKNNESNNNEKTNTDNNNGNNKDKEQKEREKAKKKI